MEDNHPHVGEDIYTKHIQEGTVHNDEDPEYIDNDEKDSVWDEVEDANDTTA